MTPMQQEDTDSRRDTAQDRSERIILFLGAAGLLLWLVLLPVLVQLVPFWNTFMDCYTALGPLGLVALLTWAVKAGMIRRRVLEGVLIPTIGAGTLLGWAFILTILSAAMTTRHLGQAWRSWKDSYFLLGILISLIVSFAAGILVRQGLRNLGRMSGLQWLFPSGLCLITGSLLWAALFPIVLMFIAFAVTG
jgi:hypothetical protein